MKTVLVAVLAFGLGLLVRWLMEEVPTPPPAVPTVDQLRKAIRDELLKQATVILNDKGWA